MSIKEEIAEYIKSLEKIQEHILKVLKSCEQKKNAFSEEDYEKFVFNVYCWGVHVMEPRCSDKFKNIRRLDKKGDITDWKVHVFYRDLVDTYNKLTR